MELEGVAHRIVRAERIKELQAEIAAFQTETKLNGFQDWIVNKLYQFKPPQGTRSVIIAAVPCQAAYANVTLYRNGKTYRVFGAVRAPLHAATKAIAKAARENGYKIKEESRLPLKRLAVQSGLAQYGKNNITYVEGMGSFCAYLAFFSDLPCQDDTWREVAVSPACGGCQICRDHCPTGAIRPDVFLLDSERCLAAVNEDTRDFPDWVPVSAHHTPYDCLKCQACCPMNAGHLSTIDIAFDDAETERILAGGPYVDADRELKQKIEVLMLDKWPSIPRNLQKLLDLMDAGHAPAL